MVVPSSNSLQTKLFKLMADKEKLESQINTYGEILSQNRNVGMNDPLIDDEGFPRNDIDVYQVRRARQQIICLQNDHKTLMNNIEQLMYEVHANAKQECLSSTIEGMNLNANSHTDCNSCSDAMVLPAQVPILNVKGVVDGSPAELAGLRQDDVIIEFGSINSNNFDRKLDTIASLVNHMRGQRVPLTVFRNNETMHLVLIPQTWSGPGLLGCNVTCC